jgi:glycosyltransferase involved in cell wall biosynthesis
MRIIVVFHLGDVSGPAKTLLPRVARLARNHDVEVIIPRAGAIAPLYASFAKITVLPSATPTMPETASGYVGAGARLIRDALRFGKFFKERRPAVVLAATTRAIGPILGARLAGIPLMIYAAETADRGYKRGLARRLAAFATVHLVARSAAAIVACSRTVERQFGETNPRVTTIYPGIAQPGIQGDRMRLRDKLGLRDQPLLAVIGNVSHGRGQDLVIRALPLVRKTLPNAQLVIAGEPLPNVPDAAYAAALRRLTRNLSLEHVIHFLGFVGDIQDVYAAADIVINPARINEGFGRVALEALAASRPVIAARVGAIPEVLRDGQDALLVEPGDPRTIASAIIRLVSDRTFADRLAVTGHERVEAEFAEAPGVEAFVALVEGMNLRN